MADREGYKLRIPEPPDLASHGPQVRRLFWTWVVDLGLKRKDKELSQGLDKDGKPLRAISAYTRKHRRSAMTPSGKGDPSAPPLTPGHQKSRTRSLLAGRVVQRKDGGFAADFWWRYDAWTGDSWMVVLNAQAKKGRDVFGLSDAGTAWVKTQAWAKWESYKRGTLKTPAARKPVAVGVPQIGDYDETYATYGIGASSSSHFTTGQWTGGLTYDQLIKHFRGSARASIPGRAANPKAPNNIVGPGYNRLLSHVWGTTKNQGPGPGRTGSAAPKPTSPGPRVSRIAKLNTPAPKPVPKPTFEKALAAAMKAAQDVDARRAAIVATVKAYAVPGPVGTFHGMTSPTPFKTIEFWGIKWHFTGRIDDDSPIVKTIRDFGAVNARQSLPNRVVEATKEVYFTRQSNKHDAHWRKVYKNFTASAATGGDGTVVVYKHKALSLHTFAHESGHNLAKEVYGATNPTLKPSSDYAALVARGVEPPVSTYAKNSPSEDFAEAVRVYVQDRDMLRRQWPERFKVIAKLISDRTYAG
jgi:hypothetical protein